MIRKTFGIVEAGVDRDAQVVELRVLSGAATGVAARSVRLTGMDEVETTLAAHAGRRARLSRDQAAALKWARGMLA